MSTARADSSERSTTGDRVPPGASISSRFQLCTAPDPRRRARNATRGADARSATVRLNSPVSPVVDRYELGPIGTNCYIVRAERTAPEAVVVDPGGDAAQLRLELARMGA